MINNNTYVAIQGWMINELGLSGNELMTYALIYGFSQDGKSDYHGGIGMIRDWLNCGSKTTVINILKSLVRQGHIEKATVYKPGTKCVAGCRYFATICHQIFQSDDRTSKPELDFEAYRAELLRRQSSGDENAAEIPDTDDSDIPGFVSDSEKTLNENIDGTNSVMGGGTKNEPPIQHDGIPNSVPGGTNSETGIPNSVPGAVQNLYQGVPNSVPNNHDNHEYNIHDNKNTHIKRASESKNITAQNTGFFSDKNNVQNSHRQKKGGGLLSEKYAEMIFAACEESHVPNCNGNFTAFSQRDLRLAMSGIHELSLSDTEVVSAIKNYGSVLDLMREGKTWWSRELRIDQLFSGQKKAVMNFLPDNFRIEDFLALNPKAPAEMTIAEKRAASNGWDKIF